MGRDITAGKPYVIYRRFERYIWVHRKVAQMMYADNYCRYKEEHSPAHVYVFTGKCIITKKDYSVRIPGKELYAYRRGALIQVAMPSVSDEDREFLMSGISPEGWKKTFPAGPRTDR